MTSKAERVAQIIHDEIVSLRVGAFVWDQQPESYRQTVANSGTVARIIAAAEAED